MTAVRNGLAALAAILLLLLSGHALAPVLASALPGPMAVSGALGLLGCFLTMIYKLVDTGLAVLRWGVRTPPTSSRWVSVLGGASILGLVAGAFVVVATALIEQALPLLRASPGTAVTVASPLAHLPLLQLVAVLATALLLGAWIGRRHGRPTVGIVTAFALLGWATMLTIDVLAGLRTAASMHSAFGALAQAPSLATARAAELPLLAGVFLAAMLGAWLGGGSRSRNRGRQPLALEG